MESHHLQSLKIFGGGPADPQLLGQGPQFAYSLLPPAGHTENKGFQLDPLEVVDRDFQEMPFATSCIHLPRPGQPRPPSRLFSEPARNPGQGPEAWKGGRLLGPWGSPLRCPPPLH